MDDAQFFLQRQLGRCLYLWIDLDLPADVVREQVRRATSLEGRVLQLLNEEIDAEQFLDAAEAEVDDMEQYIDDATAQMEWRLEQIRALKAS